MKKFRTGNSQEVSKAMEQAQEFIKLDNNGLSVFKDVKVVAMMAVAEYYANKNGYSTFCD